MSQGPKIYEFGFFDSPAIKDEVCTRIISILKSEFGADSSNFTNGFSDADEVLEYISTLGDHDRARLTNLILDHVYSPLVSHMPSVDTMLLAYSMEIFWNISNGETKVEYLKEPSATTLRETFIDAFSQKEFARRYLDIDPDDVDFWHTMDMLVALIRSIHSSNDVSTQPAETES